MNKYLVKLANHLDNKGLHKEADYVDWILRKRAEETDSERRERINEREDQISIELDTLGGDVMAHKRLKENAKNAVSALKNAQAELIEGSVNVENLQSVYFENDNSLPCDSLELQEKFQMEMSISTLPNTAVPIVKYRPGLKTLSDAAKEYKYCRGGRISLGAINQIARLQNNGVELFNSYIDRFKQSNTGKYIEREMGGLDQYKAKKVFLQNPQNLFD